MFLNDNGSDIRSMEHPTLKVPYEILNKKYRATQKSIDREVSYLNSKLDEIQRRNPLSVSGDQLSTSSSSTSSSSSTAQIPPPPPPTTTITSAATTMATPIAAIITIPTATTTTVSSTNESVAMDEDHATPSTCTTGAAMSQILDGVVEKLVVLKRKADESIIDEREAAQVCKRRLEHLKDGIRAPNPVALGSWKKKRLDRMLVDYFLRNGYYESAIKLAQHSDIEDLTNIDLFLIAREVENSLKAKETSKCLAWCHDNRSKLRKIHSTLEFKLRQQEFIELVREDKRVMAIRYARKFLSCVEEGQQEELQHVMGLLAFPADTQQEPYKTSFDESRWQLLVENFREDNFNLFQLSPVSVFSVVLHAGLSALKTPHCYRRNSERNNDCPICSDPLNKLAKDLPYPHCSQSKLICAITGEPLNEHNTPLVLPNGQVYGKKGLTALAEQNNGIITCPRTQEQFKLHQADKVYVM